MWNSRFVDGPTLAHADLDLFARCVRAMSAPSAGPHFEPDYVAAHWGDRINGSVPPPRGIYLTHCSAKKDDAFKGTGRQVSPCRLYTATPTQRFMARCKAVGVRWAIFSDRYGVWFPEIAHEWYEKNPDMVSEREFRALGTDFDEKLRDYAKIYFYYNPGRFHPLYQRLLQATALSDKIERITHLAQIPAPGR